MSLIHRVTIVILIGVVSIAAAAAAAADDSQLRFQVGYAERDITPPPGLPMWGYGARHALPATGTLDPLLARVVVVQAGDAKLAMVGLDLGRGPTREMMQSIRDDLKTQAGIEHVLISGSHTHHGPVIELVDRVGYGRGHFDAAVAYSQSLPGQIVEAIRAADASARPARIGTGVNAALTLNRNRQTKRQPKAVDPTLGVIRFDDLEGHPIAVVVNFAAHPVMTNVLDLRWSADYPGHLVRRVQQELQAGCVFMQGASGDLSPNAPEEHRGPQAFGDFLGTQVLDVARQIETQVPQRPSIKGRVDHFRFDSRIDFTDPLIQLQYSAAFFPDLIRNFVDEFSEGIPAELNTIVLNDQVALVGGSGEFFCNHANRLRERSYVEQSFFFGYCNGHSLYFPTIEATSEGGYGADEAVSPVAIGAGETMMNRALINIYTLLGRLPAEATATTTSQPAPFSE